MPHTSKGKQVLPQEKVFNSILIKNELSAQMRTWQSANITNYLALTKWRFDRSRINCIRFRSQLNNSVWCSIRGSYSKIQKLPIQTNLSNIISHKLYFKNMKWITVWMLKASCAEMFWWYYHYCEIIPQFVDSFLQTGKPLLIITSETLCLFEMPFFLYPIRLLTCSD